MRLEPLRKLMPAWLAAAAALFTAVPATAQEPASTSPVAGIWQGTLTVPTARLRLVVKLGENAGALTGTLDSIDQGARDLRMDTVRFESGRLTFELRMIGGRYEGTLAESGDEIAGTWSQGGGSLPLVLTRDANVPVVNRPQEPKRPLPYREEEVAYDSEPGVRLAATLTLPPGAGPFPAVVLITGSGPQDRDEALAGHRPFYVLADALTRRGFAVLRADDRGVGRSTGDFSGASSSEDFATDALAGVGLLAARADIRRDAIGLVGHSEGGLVAPLAAVRDVPEARELDFLVLLAGPGVPLGEILVEQSRLILAASGIPASYVDADAVPLRRLIEIAQTDQDFVRAATAMRAVLTTYAAQLPEAARVPLTAQIDQQVRQMNSPWMRWMLAYDPLPALRRLEIPVLALFGERDLQVPPAQSLAPLASAVRAAGHPASKVLQLPGLNHLFQAAGTGAPAEYSTIEETMSPAALELIGDWLLEQASALAGPIPSRSPGNRD
jgi:pimeloyl-ACP methyl ester carboxylesterase